MKKIFQISTGFILVSMIMLLSLGIASAQERYFSEDAWAFGVMADTQWYVGDENDDPEGVNPEFVAAAMAREAQTQFINHGGVKLVVQVGDLTDRAGNEAMHVRAEAAQPLFDAGIGYWPLRGNHESYGGMYLRDPLNDLNLAAYKDAFKQTRGVANTFGATNISVPTGTSPKDATRDRAILGGLSYSFDYGDQGNNARFVIVDVEGSAVSNVTPAPHPVYGSGAFYFGFTVYKYTEDLSGTTGAWVDGVWSKVPATIPAGEYFRISSKQPCTDFYGWNNGEKTKYNAGGYVWPIADFLTYVTSTVSKEFWPGDQQDWIDQRLNKATRGTEHAFVFAHRGIMGANHADGFFGSDPDVTPDDQNAFYASMYNNDAKYMLVGHDHLHNRAIVASPDGLSTVQQTIHMALSTKFYDAASLNGFSDQKPRETIISQEVFNFGYYIYTIDGPRVHVDYYTDATGNFKDYPDYPLGATSTTPLLHKPPVTWVKKGSWGYSLNGDEYVVAQGAAYPVIEDTYNNTMVKIVAGVNTSASVDRSPQAKDTDGKIVSAPRPLNKVVNTGWQAKNRLERKVYSDIFSIWGMGELGTKKTDEYVVFMKVDMDPKEFNRTFPEAYLRQGKIGVSALNSEGEWVNAVDLNIDNTPRPRPVWGPYDPNVHKLGDWGIVPLSSEYSRKEFGTVWAVVNYNADFAITQFGQKAACFNCYKKK